MYQSLYRKYRPTNFDGVVGQKIIIQILKNAIKNNTLSHAYLFCGPRGTGKTSTAKILAKIVNCENLQDYNPCNKCVNCTQYNNKQAIDVIEIDAASNNGVEEIRELKSKINLVPSFGKYKIYIIDEVHMLSTGAFNALLKTLEEPPEHVIFILATTDPYKIPATILSRCQKLDFKKIDSKYIIERLKYVSQQEKINIDDEALEEISYLSDGGMRDALGLLDEALAYTDGKITIEDIHEINGTITPKIMGQFINILFNNDLEKCFAEIDKFNIDGKDFYKLTEEIITFLRNILISKTLPNYFNNSNEYNFEVDTSIIMQYIKEFNMSLYQMKQTNNPKLIFELAIISLIDQNKVDKKNLYSNIDNKSIEIDETIINKIKKIRINNTLCNFNKKDYLEFKSKLDNLKISLFEKKYVDFISLILDGDIKAYGQNYFIIVFQNPLYVEKFNNNYKIIDEIFYNTYKQLIKGIAVDVITWNKIKNEFNKKIKEYKYIEE